MRIWGGWRERLKVRWIEGILLLGFLGLLVWLGTAAAPMVRSLLPTPTPTMVPQRGGEFDGEVAYQHVTAQMALGPRPTGSEANLQNGRLHRRGAQAAGLAGGVPGFHL